MQETSILRTHGYKEHQREEFMAELGMDEADWHEWVRTEVIQTLGRWDTLSLTMFCAALVLPLFTFLRSVP